MENATKALLMAAGVLIGIITISLMIIMLKSNGQVSSSYDQRISQEEVTIFNSNFAKYIGRDLTASEAQTIVNYAKSNSVTASVVGVLVDQIMKINNLNNKYTLTINTYDSNTGKINKITITKM